MTNPPDKPAFNLPQRQIVAVRDVMISVDPASHPYETVLAEAIEQNWAVEQAANPALFNGQVCMLAEAALSGGRLSGRCHLVRFATLLYWRKNRAAATAEHIFAHAMPVSADGALIAIRMGRHTANPGRIYFAAGSFDNDDITDGRIDVKGNMRREVVEEPGLDLHDARADFGYRLYAHDRNAVLLRRYRFDMTAEELADRIADHVAHDPAPEIEGPVIIRKGEALPGGLMPHMEPVIAWHFSRIAG